MSIATHYPGAFLRPSVIRHPMRAETRGVVIHWTAGHLLGDLSVLDGPSVDVHFYVAKSGDVYQLLDPDSTAWHAKTTANNTCVGIETEGFGEAWTDQQLEAVAGLAAWVCDRYGIPIRKVDPPMQWSGIFGHRDLSLGGPRVDGNDHTDTVPDGTGWATFLARVRAHSDGAAERPDDRFYFEDYPWNLGGDGPRELGPWASELAREAVYLAGRALGRIYSRQSIAGRPGILWWKPGTYDGYPYIWGPYQDADYRDNGQRIWQERLGRKLRPFQGINRSIYYHRHR